MTLYVGTSGWAYPEWRPDFYPAGLTRARFLEHYVRCLSACEVNATFYRVQSPETFQRWSASSPECFRFAIKAHRRLTHARNLAPNARARELLARFLASLEPLGARLGPLLLQFPPQRTRDDEALDALLDSLPPGARCALEFRHDSWSSPDVAAHLARRGHTICLSHVSGAPPSALPAGALAYVRLRADRYSVRQRRRWLALLRAEAEERDVYVFTKHEGAGARDPFTGVGLAKWLNHRARAVGRELQTSSRATQWSPCSPRSPRGIGPPQGSRTRASRGGAGEIAARPCGRHL